MTYRSPTWRALVSAASRLFSTLGFEFVSITSTHECVRHVIAWVFRVPA
jgi:hypothetical protein